MCSHALMRAMQRALAIAISGAASSLSAQAQGAAGGGTPAAGPTEEVIVTGTRIISPNMVSTSPIQVITSKEIQQQGRKDISDVLYQMPQNFNNSFSGFSNRTSGLTTAGGIATADLRGLGAQRTLVLVNGRRLGPGSPDTSNPTPSPDLDQIPTQLVERVDVVTGGASATYGSDAIAGVINFIIKRDFEGVEFDYQYGENWHNNHNDTAQSLERDFGVNPDTGNVTDGSNYNATLTAGKNFADGRGNVTAYVGYLRGHPVISGARDFGNCQLFMNDDLTGPVCGGSANSNIFTPNPLIANPQDYAVVGNNFEPWPAAGQNPPAEYNSQRLIYVSRDDERKNAGVFAHYEINDYADPYLEFGYMKDETHQQVAPSGLFLGQNVLDPSGSYQVNCGNPFLSAQQRAIMLCGADPSQIVPIDIGRRSVEGPGRTTDFNHENYRGVLGVKGQFGGAYSYDVYGQYYRVTLDRVDGNYLNLQSVANALLASGTAGSPACISGPPCVPWNIFADGGVTDDALNYLLTNASSTGKVIERVYHADVTADLGEYGVRLPTATEGVGVNVGYERRSESLSYQPDAVSQSGLLAGFGGAAVPINEDYVVNEQFIEVRVPILQDRPGAEYLGFDGGYRRSDYTTIGVVNTEKFEVQYAPIRDVRLRGSYQKAIRAPSLIELFSPLQVGQISFGEDPCAPSQSTGVPARSLEECLRTGVTAQQYNSGTIPQGTASQLSQVLGGEPDLKAETAKSYTLGITLSPSFLPDFSASLDWFRVKVDDEVDQLPATVIMDNCLDTGDPAYCSQIVRSPVTGGLNGGSVQSGGYIVQTNTNVGKAEVQGIDVQAAYRWAISDYGSLLFSLAGTYLDKFETTPVPGGGSYDCAGLFGPTCQTVNPEWRSNFRISWLTPWNVNASVLWRFMTRVKLDNNDSNPLLFGSVSDFGQAVPYNSHIGSYSYFDLNVSWHVNDMFDVRAGINNVFDKDPPFVVSELISGGAANTYETYDTLGRQVYIGFTASYGKPTP